MANANLFLFKDNVSTVLASSLSSTATTCVVATGTGADFPTPSSGQQLAVTIEDVMGNIEVVYCTGITGDTLTIVRAREGTTAQNFASGSYVEMRVTSGILSSFLQKNGGDTLTNTTTLAGILQLNSNGSIQGGEFTGALRGAPGQTEGQIVVANGGATATQNGSVILTEANLTANLPSGYGLFVTGMIALWYGASDAIPTGFVICDGTGGTPDLINNFVIGAGGTYTLGETGGTGPEAGLATGSTNPISSLTIAGTALTVAQMPSHTHQYYYGGVIDYGGDAGGPALTVGTGGTYVTNLPGGTGISSAPFLQTTGGPSSPGGTVGNGATHTHALGGTLAHTHAYDYPPYVALFYIMKT
jgi:hypothetical protein